MSAQGAPLNRQTARRFVRAVSELLTSEVRRRAIGLPVLLLVFALSVNGLNVVNIARAAQVSNMAPCPPSGAQETILESFLVVHVVCSDVLLEIPVPMLGRSFLVYTEFAALSTGGAEYAPGTAVDSRVMQWLRIGSKVALITASYDNWAGESSALQRGVEDVSLPTVVEVFDVMKEGAGGAPVINITSLFTTNPPTGFALEFKRHYRMAQIDGHRSLVQSVRAFPKNIAFGFYQTWIPEEKDLLKPPKDQDPPPPALGFFFKTNLLLLPEKPMAGRCEESGWAFSQSPSATTAPTSIAW